MPISSLPGSRFRGSLQANPIINLKASRAGNEAIRKRRIWLVKPEEAGDLPDWCVRYTYNTSATLYTDGAQPNTIHSWMHLPPSGLSGGYRTGHSAHHPMDLSGSFGYKTPSAQSQARASVVCAEMLMKEV